MQLCTSNIFVISGFAIKKGNGKVVQDEIKALHKRKTNASIIKHSIIHINMYLEKGMNVVFHHHPNAFSSYFFQFLCIPFVYCLYFSFVIHRVGKY